jgi:hypothetical protein
MKLTESILKRIIKEAIKEEESKARGIAGLPDGVYIDIEKSEDGYVIRYATEDRKSPMKEFGFSGYLVTGPVEKFECLGAFEVDYVTVTPKNQGYAPLLYDIAMELSTLLGAKNKPPTGGLTSGRYSVAPEARRIWDYYSKERSGPGGDVTAIQLDDEKNTYTDPLEDNCAQNIVRSTMTGLNAEIVGHPLSKVYRKQPVILRALGDKLRIYKFELNL